MYSEKENTFINSFNRLLFYYLRIINRQKVKFTGGGGYTNFEPIRYSR